MFIGPSIGVTDSSFEGAPSGVDHYAGWRSGLREVFSSPGVYAWVRKQEALLKPH